MHRHDSWFQRLKWRLKKMTFFSNFVIWIFNSRFIRLRCPIGWITRMSRTNKHERSGQLTRKKLSWDVDKNHSSPLALLLFHHSVDLFAIGSTHLFRALVEWGYFKPGPMFRVVLGPSSPKRRTSQHDPSSPPRRPEKQEEAKKKKKHCGGTAPKNKRTKILVGSYIF